MQTGLLVCKWGDEEGRCSLHSHQDWQDFIILVFTYAWSSILFKNKRIWQIPLVPNPDRNLISAISAGHMCMHYQKVCFFSLVWPCYDSHYHDAGEPVSPVGHVFTPALSVHCGCKVDIVQNAFYCMSYTKTSFSSMLDFINNCAKIYRFNILNLNFWEYFMNTIFFLHLVKQIIKKA